MPLETNDTCSPFNVSAVGGNASVNDLNASKNASHSSSSPPVGGRGRLRNTCDVSSLCDRMMSFSRPARPSVLVRSQQDRW